MKKEDKILGDLKTLGFEPKELLRELQNLFTTTDMRHYHLLNALMKRLEKKVNNNAKNNRT